MTLNEANLKKAYFEVIACTGIGAAVNDGEALLVEKCFSDGTRSDATRIFPHRLLGCAIQVCASEPYLWTVQNIEPTIDQDTTFQSLWDHWIIEIVNRLINNGYETKSNSPVAVLLPVGVKVFCIRPNLG